MYTEDQLLPLSALQHLAFCERRCALVHIEQNWEENKFTAEGRILHEKVHEQDSESRGTIRIVRGLRLRSLRLGLIGQADVVEFHQQSDGTTIPFPVEYKRGKQTYIRYYNVQLCAQALCLEEALGGNIPRGAIFYGQPRRRKDVEFSEDLRKQTETAALRLHELINKGVTPPALYTKKCENCSLKQVCLPETAGQRKSAKRYLGHMLSDEKTA